MCIVCVNNNNSVKNCLKPSSNHEENFTEMFAMNDIPKCAVTLSDMSCLDQLKVPLPAQEHDRIRILREAKLFDTEAEETYDRFTGLAARSLKVSSTVDGTVPYSSSPELNL